MSLTIVTGWSPSGWKQYAHRFAETFPRYWPKSVTFVAYVEEMQWVSKKDPPGIEHIEQRSVLNIPECERFLNSHKGVPRSNGREVRPNWKDSAKAAGYNFRFDAWKFSRQGFIPYDALQKCDTEFMAWFDADVITKCAVPEDFVESLMPVGKDVAYLGRHPKFSEIGFQLYRNNAGAKYMARVFSEQYASEAVFLLKEWHSAYVFDHAVRVSEVAAHNLTPGGHGNVWEQSPLNKYTDHLKGKRKYNV